METNIQLIARLKDSPNPKLTTAEYGRLKQIFNTMFRMSIAGDISQNIANILSSKGKNEDYRCVYDLYINWLDENGNPIGTRG